MKTLDDIRKAYPQYADMSDEKLATALHNKFYSDMPFNEFAQKVGLAQEKKPVDFSIGETVSNIPASAAQFGENIAQPFIHPVNTAKSLVNLASGVVDKGADVLTKALPEDFVRAGNKLNNWLADNGVPLKRLPEEPSQLDFPNKKYAEQMGEFIKSRYGSVDNFKRTVMNDPVGVLADASAAISGGGALLGSGKLAKLGAATEPFNIVKNAGKVALKGIPGKIPQKLYASAAKFSTTIPKAKREQMIQTALDNGILPTSKGVDKLSGLIGDLDMRINGLVQAATNEGKVIPRKALFTYFKGLRQNLGGAKIEGGNDLKVINRVAKTIDEHLKKTGRDYLTPDELQNLKQDAYKRINFDRSQGKSRLAKEEAYKATARAAKNALESVAPEVGPLNRRLGDLLQIQEPIQRSANRIDQLNVIPLTAPLNIGAGAQIGGQAGTGAGVLASILEMPRSKSWLATKLNALQQQKLTDAILNNNLMLTGGRNALYQVGRNNMLQSQ